MIFFNLMKQIKKRLRRVKRPLLSLCAITVVVALLAVGLRLRSTSETQSVIQMLSDHKQERQVHLTKAYVCGEETLQLGFMKSEDIIELLLKHPTWSGTADASGNVWIKEDIEDLSESCKKNGYFSVDRSGNLVMFDGPPKKEKVMKTFFQMDIKSMESSLPDHVLKQLYQGIRISDVDEYNSVLSTFSDYAVEQTEKVMKRTSY